jgi:hypothetical protein
VGGHQLAQVHLVVERPVQEVVGHRRHAAPVPGVPHPLQGDLEGAEGDDLRLVEPVGTVIEEQRHRCRGDVLLPLPQCRHRPPELAVETALERCLLQAFDGVLEGVG